MKRIALGCLALVVAAASLAQEAPAPQTTPPAPAAPREAKVPQPVEKTLPNGLRVIVVPKHDTPLVAARLMIRSGGASDPKGREGLAQTTAAVLTKGTKSASAEEIARGVEALGATLDASAGWDRIAVDVSVLSTNLPKAMHSVADVVRNPTFPKQELELQRSQELDALQVALREPRSLASMVANRLVYGSAPYGHDLSGTLASLHRITRDDLVRFHRAWFRPENAILLFAGDIDAEAAFALAAQEWGSWSRGSASAAMPAGVTEFPAPRVVVVDVPDAGQAAVVVSRPGIRRADPAYMQAIVTNAVLGGGYSARLNQEIRIKRGLSYGAGSYFVPRAAVGPFSARTETKNESAAEVAGIILSEIKRLTGEDVAPAELIPRKASLIGEFGQSLETTSGIVDEMSALALYGLPLTELNQYIGGVQAVTPAQVRSFAATNLGTGASSVVVVGDAKQFVEPLRKQFPDVEVIAVGELDLDSPTLRVRKKKE